MCASSRNGPTPLLSRSVPEAQIRDLARNSCTTYNSFMDGNKRDAKGKQQPLAPTQPGPDRQPLPPQRSLVPGRPFPPYRPCSIRPFSSLRRAHCRRAGVGAGKDPGTKWPSSRPSLPKLRRRFRRRDQDRKGEGFGCSGGPPGGSTGGDGGSLRGPVSRRGDIRYGRGDRGGLRRQNPRSWDRGLEVHVENNVNALTLAEARCVSGRGSRTLSSRWRRVWARESWSGKALPGVTGGRRVRPHPRGPRGPAGARLRRRRRWGAGPAGATGEEGFLVEAAEGFFAVRLG